ncbi:MAG: peptidase MA family metallohydrolase, partial [Chloroflexota bacterium]
AVYSEGELGSASQAQLDQAIRSDQLLTVRSLSAGFSEVPDRAYLSYSQSYSIVKFLIETYGQEKMNALLAALRDGTTIDDALRDIYGFDVEGLEDAWRSAIGAAPRPASAQATAQPTPTFVPTYIPYAGAPLAVTPTPYFVPTSSVSNTTPTRAGESPPVILTILLAVFCCLLFLFFVVIVLGFVLAAQKQKGGSHATK